MGQMLLKTCDVVQLNRAKHRTCICWGAAHDACGVRRPRLRRAPCCPRYRAAVSAVEIAALPDTGAIGDSYDTQRAQSNLFSAEK